MGFRSKQMVWTPGTLLEGCPELRVYFTLRISEVCLSVVWGAKSCGRGCFTARVAHPGLPQRPRLRLCRPRFPSPQPVAAAAPHSSRTDVAVATTRRFKQPCHGVTDTLPANTGADLTLPPHTARARPRAPTPPRPRSQQTPPLTCSGQSESAG